MIQNYLEEIKTELRKGATEKNHPFRYFTLATVGLERVARLRTVVLRKFADDLNLIFYTDSRSKKMIHLQENKNVGLLFYNPQTLTQIRIEGVAKAVDDKEAKSKAWKNIDPKARKDYTTVSTPGTSLSGPDQLDYLEDADHFAIIEIIPFKIEYLQLKRPNHIRVNYSREGDKWEGEFIVP
ncbi:pyridoxamine 5'-phosphate oxidase family protein [Muriicola soli]|uniref:Pyridoxamine 5'-phosphate oxidase n=1 Tax=Muriicola soli TaxID=2507538 RepID=A0A411E7V2_9FLAO|nr:pyridoxamine 5'-phosphate oxidase family protein [Muriicola soli]QBA63728.1 pyridoxamine 5'-phosphate oxidase [Muriicola soli]